MKSKQITFCEPTVCTHIFPDGTMGKVRYGYYESIMIVKENGWPVDRCVVLTMPTYLVQEVIKENGTKVVFDSPFWCIAEKEFGDGSGRVANQIQKIS